MSIEKAWTPEVQQSVFRVLLESTSRPGKVLELLTNVSGLTPVLGVLATLVDGAVSLHDRTKTLEKRVWSFLQARPECPEKAHFILASGSSPPDFSPCLGSLESPETGATLVITVDSLGYGPLSLVLQGPGIQTRHLLSLGGLATEWLETRQAWNRSLPLGVDMVLVDDLRVCALPRTTHLG